MEILILAGTEDVRDKLFNALRLYGHHVVARSGIDDPLGLPAYPELAVVSASAASEALDLVKIVRGRTELANSWILVVCEGLSQAESHSLLDAGAGDCYAHKFIPTVFAARARKLLRRPAPTAAQADPNKELRLGSGLALDMQRRKVLADGAPIELAARQFDILAALVRSKNRPVAAADLLSILKRSVLNPTPSKLAQEVEVLRAKLGRFGALVASDPAGGYKISEPGST